MEPEPYIEQAWGSFGKNYYSNSHSSFNFDINDKYNLLQYINTNSYPKVDLKWDFHIEDNDDDISNGYPNYLSNRRQTNEILNTNITSLKLNTPPNYPIRPVVSNDNIVTPSFNDLITEWDVSKVTDMDLKNNDNDDL